MTSSYCYLSHYFHLTISVHHHHTFTYRELIIQSAMLMIIVCDIETCLVFLPSIKIPLHHTCGREIELVKSHQFSRHVCPDSVPIWNIPFGCILISDTPLTHMAKLVLSSLTELLHSPSPSYILSQLVHP